MQKKPLAIFDFDGTMLDGDSIIRYVVYAIEKGFESKLRVPLILIESLLAVCGIISAETGKSRALSFLGRMTESEQVEFNQSFCRDKLLPRLYPQAVMRMNEHAAQGCHILLVSASPDIYIEYLKQYLPIDDVLASPTDVRGLVSASTKGNEKARRVKEWAELQRFDIDWVESFSYGNSSNDLPVMGLTGHPTCINPSNSMKKLAPKLPREHWSIDNSKTS